MALPGETVYWWFLLFVGKSGFWFSKTFVCTEVPKYCYGSSTPYFTDVLVSELGEISIGLASNAKIYYWNL